MSGYLPYNRNSWPAPASHPRRDTMAAQIARGRRDADMAAEERRWQPYADEVEEWAERRDDAAEPD